ncbi:MAG: oligosaccharide flippase family protein [Pirellulaceae bacterium]|nr:oligosaccharide flippase family protein [Pirellulaceae bacterium]
MNTSSDTSDSADSPPTDLAGSVRRGTRVVLLAQVASQLVSLVVLGVLLRMVAVEDYGLVGLLLPAVMLPRMAATLGLATVVQQRSLSAAELSSLFWLNVVWGMLATSVTIVSSLWLGQWYDEPLLLPLGAALAGTTLLAALANQHQALLERRLAMAPLAGARLLAQACGGAAGIYAAWRGAGVWALVAQQYGELAVLTLWVWQLEPWRPGWPERRSQVSQHVRYSSFYSLSQLVYYVAQNLDKLLFPLLLAGAAPRAIGLYSQAFNVMTRSMYLLTSPLSGLFVAGLSRSEADPAARRDMLVRFVRQAAIGLLPCAVGLGLVATETMQVLGGAKWQAAGPVLRVLAPAIFVQGLINLSMLVLAAAGRAGRILAFAVLATIVLAVAAAAGIDAGPSLVGLHPGPGRSLAAALRLGRLAVDGSLAAIARGRAWARRARRAPHGCRRLWCRTISPAPVAPDSRGAPRPSGDRRSGLCRIRLARTPLGLARIDPRPRRGQLCRC